MITHKTFKPVIITAASIALVAGIWLGIATESAKQIPPPQIHGTLLPVAKAITALQLLDHNNQVFTEHNLQGHWSVIFLGFTHCPDICPTTLNTLQQTVELMQQQATTPPKVIFISVDPARDTPDVLRKYLTFFNRDFIGLSGSDEQLVNISKQLAVSYNKAAGASGDINNNDYFMEHSTAILLINPKAELQAYLTAPHTPEHLVESIQRSMDFYLAQQ
jgi:protein SCO1